MRSPHQVYIVVLPSGTYSAACKKIKNAYHICSGANASVSLLFTFLFSLVVQKYDVKQMRSRLKKRSECGLGVFHFYRNMFFHLICSAHRLKECGLYIIILRTELCVRMHTFNFFKKSNKNNTETTVDTPT